MKQLINIQTREGISVVSARELHHLLNVKTRFNDWINNRLAEYQFRCDLDFTKISVKPLYSGRPQKDYALTLDTAKELAMIEKTERGRSVRQYFIECEKKLHEKIQTHNEVFQLNARYGDIQMTRIMLNREAAKIRNRLRSLEPSHSMLYLSMRMQTELFQA